MVHHPQRGFGDAGGELFDLDAVELVDVDARQGGGVQLALAFGVKLQQEVKFQRPKLAVGDDKEVAATAGRVEEGKAGQFVMEA